ncbi:hypothetical protein H9P43_001179 [Blastocladiella emersonii ATCC 22665]|nr:hypothetical protein H9P43_001179 [Blastocladiella emersonii ATCC 22665]
MDQRGDIATPGAVMGGGAAPGAAPSTPPHAADGVAQTKVDGRFVGAGARREMGIPHTPSFAQSFALWYPGLLPSRLPTHPDAHLEPHAPLTGSAILASGSAALLAARHYLGPRHVPYGAVLVDARADLPVAPTAHTPGSGAAGAKTVAEPRWGIRLDVARDSAFTELSPSVDAAMARWRYLYRGAGWGAGALAVLSAVNYFRAPM